MKLLWNCISDFIEDGCMQLAAALAFYALLSLTPLLVLVINLAGLFVSPTDIQGEVAGIARSIMGPQGGEQLRAMMESGSIGGNGVLSRVVSGVVLILGATGVMVQLQVSLNHIWDVRPLAGRSGVKGFFVKRIISLAMNIAVAFILLISLIVTTTLRALGDQFAGVLDSKIAQFAIGETATAVTVILLFGAMFKVLPDAKISWRDVWFGAAITALFFTAGKFLIGLYLGSQSLGSTYGAASSLVLILLWTYYSSLIFFFGAEVTQVWARHHGRSIEPLEGAVRVTEKKGPAPTKTQAA